MLKILNTLVLSVGLAYLSGCTGEIAPEGGDTNTPNQPISQTPANTSSQVTVASSSAAPVAVIPNPVTQPEPQPPKIVRDFSNRILPSKHCNSTAQCKITFGEQATDCTDSKSEASRCMCTQESCGDVFDAQTLVYAINVGGDNFTDNKGFNYLGDFGAVGQSKTTNKPNFDLKGSANDALFQSQRYAKTLQYELPVSAGLYNVTVKLADSSHTQSGKRVFDILIEDEVLTTNLDMIAQLGEGKGKDFTLTDVRVNDGKLTIKGEASVDNATFAAIVVTSRSGLPTCDSTCIEAKRKALIEAEPKTPKQPPKQTPQPPKQTPNAPAANGTKTVIEVNFDNYSNNKLKNYTETNLTKDFGKPSRQASPTRGFKVDEKIESLQLVEVGNKKLRATFPKNKSSGRDTGFVFDQKITGTEEATFEYDFTFQKGFEWAKGGKLPGLAGTSAKTIPVGCNDNVTDQRKGFSARLMWREKGRLVAYTYFPNRIKNNKIPTKGQGRCGIDITVTKKLESGKNYRVKQYIKLNTPNKSNGILKIELFDKDKKDKNGNYTVVDTLNLKNVKYRSDSEIKINSALFHTYRGGGRTTKEFMSKKTSYIDFDNFLLTTP